MRYLKSESGVVDVMDWRDHGLGPLDSSVFKMKTVLEMDGSVSHTTT